MNLATVQTNIVNVDVKALGIDAAAFARNLEARDVKGLPGMGTVMRFVTYRGITRNDVERAASVISEMVAARPWAAAAQASAT